MAKNKVLVAKLDKDKRLIGFLKKSKAGKNDIVITEGPDPTCDLACDGRYKWDGETFMALGHGFGKPERPPIPETKVLRLIVEAIRDKVPKEVQDWADWYDTNMSKQQEEIAKVKGV